jgi:hypothetical protein
MTPGPIQRKKVKTPLLGGICLLTTGDLIRVMRAVGIKQTLYPLATVYYLVTSYASS